MHRRVMPVESGQVEPDPSQRVHCARGSFQGALASCQSYLQHLQQDLHPLLQRAHLLVKADGSTCNVRVTTLVVSCHASHQASSWSWPCKHQAPLVTKGTCSPPQLMESLHSPYAASRLQGSSSSGTVAIVHFLSVRYPVSMRTSTCCEVLPALCASPLCSPFLSQRQLHASAIATLPALCTRIVRSEMGASFQSPARQAVQETKGRTPSGFSTEGLNLRSKSQLLICQGGAVLQQRL